VAEVCGGGWDQIPDVCDMGAEAAAATWRVSGGETVLRTFLAS